MESSSYAGASRQEACRNLVEHLGAGWLAQHADIARDFVSRWRDRFGTHTEVGEAGDGSLAFNTDLSAIRMRAMDWVPCLLIGGTGEALKNTVSEYRRAHAMDRIPVVIATSLQAYAAAATTDTRSVLLGPDAAYDLLSRDRPLDLMKGFLRKQVHRQFLIPFNIERHATGGMFWGRKKYLDRLGSDSSIAVAGPPRLGKTSLLRKYRTDLVRSRNPAAHSTFYIDLFAAERTEEGLTRKLVLLIDGSSKGRATTPDRLEPFFLFWTNHFGKPPDLLCDEVDEVLHLNVFDSLAMIARKRYCRLVLAGKARLMANMLDPSRAFASRVVVMRLEPLTKDESRGLFLKPFEDLGFVVHDRSTVLDTVCDLTGGLPHLLQYYGRVVATHLLHNGSNTVDERALLEVRDQFETQAYTLDFLMRLQPGSVKKAVALAVIKHPRRLLSLPDIHRIATDAGIELTLEETWSICNDLVLDTILSWERLHFVVANGTLAFHAERVGLI